MKKQNINSKWADLLIDSDDGAQADCKNTIIEKFEHSTTPGSAMYLFLILILGIFIGETTIMLFIDALPSLSQLGTALLNSTLLSVVVFPILYFFVFRPLMGQITERTHAEEALRKSEKLFRSLFENMLNGFAYCQMHFDDNDKPNDFTYLSVNSTFETLTKLKNVVGKKVTEVIPGIRESDSKLLEIYGRVSKTGKPEQFEMFVSSLQLWFNISAYSPEQGYFVAVFDVITERKLAEEKILDDRLLLRTLIDNIPDSIYCKDLACRKTLTNLTELRYMGVKSEAEVLGKDDFDFYPKELAEKFFTDDQSVIQTGKPVINREEYIFDEKKQKRWLLTSKLPLRDKDNRIIGLVGIGRDITEHKQAEAEIKLKNEELSKANSEKDKFLSIIAHDLRGPFNGFLGLTQIMADESSSLSTEELQQMAVSMEKSASNLFRLLENLLHWARVQQGLIPFNPLVVELLPLVDESIAIVFEQAKIKGIKITRSIPNDLTVFADYNMLQTIIRNLVSNAVKFTTKGGKVTLSAKPADDNFIIIAIKDTGIGMRQEIVEQLFRLDVQTSREGTDGEHSSGLGLILCKEFVEKHAGKIWVESEEGVGSTFYFTLASNNTK